MVKPDQAQVADLARAYVAAIAPRELPLFRPISTAYFKDPQGVFRKPGQTGAVQFGEGGAAALMTPFVLAVISEAVLFIAAEFRAQGATGADAARALTAPDRTRAYRTSLLQTIVDAFSHDELRTLCFEMGYEHDNIGAPAKEAYARELIALCERRDTLPDLIQQCERKRPGQSFRPITESSYSAYTWSSDQLKRLRRLVLDIAMRLNVPDPTGPDLANQLVLGLALA